jgi:hypothetical protein
MEETPEERDEKELREIEGEMKEVLDLLTRRQTREAAGKHLEGLRRRRDEHATNPQPAMHMDGATHAPTTMRTKTRLDLAEGLKNSIALHRHHESLETALSGLSERYVAVLERILARASRA